MCAYMLILSMAIASYGSTYAIHMSDQVNEYGYCVDSTSAA